VRAGGSAGTSATAVSAGFRSAGAGLTAAALFGSLPYQGPWQAQGLPTQHHDVALVDATDATLLATDFNTVSSDATSLLGAAL